MVSDVDDPMIESDNDSDGNDAGQAFYAGAGQQVNIILWISMFLREREDIQVVPEFVFCSSSY